MMLRHASPRQRILMPTTNSAYGTGDFCTEESPLSPMSRFKPASSLLSPPQRTGLDALARHLAKSDPKIAKAIAQEIKDITA